MDDAALNTLAVHRKRVPGETRIVALQAAVPGGPPPIVVKFIVPDGVQLAQAEAAAATALAHIREGAGALGEYGLNDTPLSESQLSALARIIAAVESAMVLWTDWNYGEFPAVPPGQTPDPAAVAVKQKLTRDKVCTVLSDTNVRSAWLIHLDQASPLERAEGNGSAVSLNGNTAEAATTAKAAPSSTSPVPEESPTQTAPTAPGSNTNP